MAREAKVAGKPNSRWVSCAFSARSPRFALKFAQFPSECREKEELGKESTRNGCPAAHSGRQDFACLEGQVKTTAILPQSRHLRRWPREMGRVHGPP